MEIRILFMNLMTNIILFITLIVDRILLKL